MASSLLELRRPLQLNWRIVEEEGEGDGGDGGAEGGGEGG